MKEKVNIEVEIAGKLNEIWEKFNQAKHVVNWNFAEDTWHCPKAENDLKIGGRFIYTMAAKDGSFSFDLKAVYNEIVPFEKISYTLEDNRLVEVNFKHNENKTIISQTFEAENENPIELQRTGWQMILNNFKKYCEN